MYDSKLKQSSGKSVTPSRWGRKMSPKIKRRLVVADNVSSEELNSLI